MGNDNINILSVVKDPSDPNCTNYPDHFNHQVGPADSTSSWSVEEVGDGNINFVYIVKGPSGALCVKQALPFVRCVGESWPLSQVGCLVG